MKQPKISYVVPDVKVKQKEFDEAVVDFVAETGVSFYALGSLTFKKLINVSNNKLNVNRPHFPKRRRGASLPYINVK